MLAGPADPPGAGTKFGSAPALRSLSLRCVMGNSFRWRALLLATLPLFMLGGLGLADCSKNLPTAVQPAAEARFELVLTPDQLTWVGRQIFQNECAAKVICLVHWNQGEAFPSLGIGHFIWYPRGVDEPFVESFPTLIAFM